MVFGFGKKKQDETDREPRIKPVRFQGALNEKDADLASNAKLVQVGLAPAKELVTQSLARGAETIRVEPKGETFVSFQVVDGLAYSSERYPKQVGNAIIQMFKLLSGLDVKLRNKPQSGGLKAEFEGQAYNLLVETSPMVGGTERLIVRVRDLSQTFESPEDLGFSDELKKRIKKRTSQHNGVLLVCGPSASGTTTTLFGVLRSIDAYTHSIYNISQIDTQEIHNITNYDVNPEDDLAATLTRLARIEADIVLVDPITDAKSAKAVFSNCNNMTLITEFRAKDAESGIRQLSEWMFVEGADSSLIAKGLQGVLSQKLIRLLCEGCKEAYRPNPKMVSKVGLPAGTDVLYRPLKKEEIAARLEEGENVPCAETGGYRGRTGLFELIEMTNEMGKLVAASAKPEQIKALARQQKMYSFYQDGLKLIAQGKTSLEELQRLLKAG